MQTVVGAASLLMILMVGFSTTASSSDVTGSRSVNSLKFVFVVSRHGNRGAHKDYALDPYLLSDPKYYPYGKGALTPRGRVQTHKLGMKVRSLYDGFLNSTFYPEEIHATSTPTERSLMSGQCFLAGLYPPQGFQVWDKDILWQPVPLYSTSPDHAHNIMGCQKYLVELEQSKIDFFKEYSLNVTEVMDYYREVAGSNVSNTFIWYLWDKLISEKTEEYSLPDWSKRFYPEPMMSIIARQCIAYYATSDTVVRLLTGNLVEEIMVTMKKKIDGELQNRRIHLYSGHDSSIIPLMVALGVPRLDVPLVMPGSALLLELHEDTLTRKHSIKVLYIDGGSVELSPQLVTLPVSDFSLLQNNSRWLFGLDYDKECQVPGADAGLISRNKWT